MDVKKYKELINNVNNKPKFDYYKELLIENNSKFNLTAVKEEEIELKHFIDSVVGCEYIKAGKLIDVGTGAGFPGIPLKIINDDLDLTLLESNGKKCGFLNNVINELQLKNAKVIYERAEDASKKVEHRENYDFAVARAVARLNTLVEYCLPFVKVGGFFVCYKSDAEEEINESKNAIKILGGQIEKVESFDLENQKRTFVIIKKIKNTPKEYPRGNGKERKKPL